MRDQKINTLIIEDNENLAFLYKKSLEKDSEQLFEVSHAGSLEEGISRIASLDLSAVLLDLNLPDSRGLDTFLRIHECTPTIPVVVLSGMDDDNLALEAVKMGAIDYLVKERVDGKIIARVLRYAVERQRTEETVYKIARDVSAATGDSFFRSLALSLTRSLDLDCAYIGEFNAERSALHTLAISRNKQITNNIIFSVEGMPDERVLMESGIYSTGNAQIDYPKNMRLKELGTQFFLGVRLETNDKEPLGVLGMMDTKDRKNDLKRLQSIASMFAGRVSAEIQWKRAKTELQEAREHEINIGVKIQQALLQGKVPENIPGLQVSALSIGGEKIDGDFYEFFTYNPSCMDVFVGDVMGKGIPVALLAAGTKTEILRILGELLSAGYVNQYPGLVEILSRTQDQVAPKLISLESFITLCYARLNLQKKSLQMIDCGHTKTLHYKQKDKKSSLLEGSNMPLGFSEDDKFEIHSWPIELGDVIILYSDGVTEARNAAGDFFGEERLQKLVDENYYLHPKNLVHHILDQVVSFVPQGARFLDDLTCVVFKVVDHHLASNSRHVRYELSSDFQELLSVRRLVKAFCQSLNGVGLDEEPENQIVLACDEIFCNIIEHAYQEAKDKRIVFEMQIVDDLIQFDFVYWGERFDPKTVPAPKFDGTQDGGFGLYIVDQSMDSIEYSFDEQNVNRIILKKKIKTKK